MARLKDKPFALIGVNSDTDRAALKSTLVKEKITWRSFWNGGSTRGPISTAWKVTGWPTLVVIGADGIIRHRWSGSPGNAVLDKAIDEQIARAEGAK